MTDAEINPVSWLSIGGSVNYTDAKNTSNIVSIAGAAPVAFDIYIDAPKWSGTAFAEVTASVGGNIEASFCGDLYAQTKAFFVGTGSLIPNAILPGYAVVNFRLDLEDTHAGWSFSANLQNALNRTSLFWRRGVGPTIPDQHSQPGRPADDLGRGAIQILTSFPLGGARLRSAHFFQVAHA